MGCDIHFFVERFDDAVGAWVTADKWKTEKYGAEEWTNNYDNAFYRDRNYVLFSVLADVRNSYDAVPLTAEPRGMTMDSCPEIVKAVTEDCDGHSVSYFTVQELMSYDWTQPLHLSGWVTMLQYLEFKRRGAPEGWCSMVGGGNIEHVSNERMEEWIVRYMKDHNINNHYALSAHLRDTNFEPMYRQYTEIKWTVPMYDMCKSFLAETMPRLWRLGPPNSVRCVFYFDN